MIYDIFLAGPWEKYSPFPYKTMIKKAFPDRKIFDPEERTTAQQTGNWFEDNYSGIENSRTMVALVPEFPFPGVAMETGMFYHKRRDNDSPKPLEELIIIWPSIVKPAYGREVIERMGYVAENPDDAILRLKKVLY